ncbi:MAG: hypothetical protein J3R72DRAFT_454493 [Linnemannia gamsii]|nr:MAG: hypothetical protein J3R72DRAFT_454493 [Linnemannia gamsii]
MEAATNRFFSIAELVTHLLQYIDNPAISRLMQTNRHLNALCTPAHYFKLKLRYNPTKHNLFDTTESIQALARNVQHVRQLYLWSYDIIYYVHCVLALQDLLYSQQHVTTITAGEREAEQRPGLLSRPSWLAPPDPSIFRLTPLPPETLLTKLELMFVEHDNFMSCPYYLPTYRDPKAIITHVCWIIDSNPHLLDLKLNGFIIKDCRDARLLTTSIFGLQKIKALSIEVTRWEDTPGHTVPQVAVDIFFACPSTLQTLRIVSNEVDQSESEIFTEEYTTTVPGTPQLWEKSDKACGWTPTSPLPRRKGPLRGLKSLTLGNVDEQFTEQDLCTVLQDCPNLTYFNMPIISDLANIPRLAEQISQNCPKLSDLSCPLYGGGGTEVRELMVRIIQALPPQQVTHFSCCGDTFFVVQGLGDAKSLFQRHSTTLRQVSFSACQNFGSKAIQAILVECQALDRLCMRWTTVDARNNQHHNLRLEDAIEFSWACTRIRELTLTIAIPEGPFFHSTAVDGAVPYYSRTPPITLSDTEQHQLAQLETLYRQLGALTGLRSLWLRAITFDPDGHHPGSTDFRQHSFPGLLNLCCLKTGRPGFLHHLGGLTKLMRLRGSFRATTPETRVTIGMEEVIWMDRHWPELESVSFYAYGDRCEDVSEPIRQWQAKRRERGLSGLNIFVS